VEHQFALSEQGCPIPIDRDRAIVATHCRCTCITFVSFLSRDGTSSASPPILCLCAKALPRNSFSEREVKEYRKTANVIAAEPWSMVRAAKYLNELCDRNLSKEWPAPLPITFFDELDVASCLHLPAPPDWMNFAVLPPRNIQLAIALPKGKAKAKAKGKALAKAAVVEEQGVPLEPVVAGKAKSKGKSKAKSKGLAKEGNDGWQVPKAKAEPVGVEAAVAAEIAPRAPAAGGQPPKAAGLEQPGPPPKAAGLKRPASATSGLGCCKCRYSARGCAQCREKAAKAKATSIAPSVAGSAVGS